MNDVGITKKVKLDEELQAEQNDEEVKRFSWAENIFKDALQNIKSDVLRSKLGG